MVLVCFVLDLCTLSPPLLKNLKQSLRTTSQISTAYRLLHAANRTLPSDKIGLCYLLNNRTSLSHELKIGYSTKRKFQSP
ncbi:hypothetical protein NC651_034557 [Populus alba x Populus x berolinensis]|nr:hypothetical protein NC651_034557 [Populus alba x Populus x berolinensis]